ncbi:hypothetical protein P171DRAFT_436599 [Karstenula rhodostoma CBS 690.94]|uniref:Uncharacterized protein n=1 Tax=Karstenula rhodostoma CBS 690.94 TaxID=1392251 RepID=A0A9P4P770_9PLEO|nr:hypothetical protein P171DRAFT_436599 [Karstenula rhodostoma CBS 690.94]
MCNVIQHPASSIQHPASSIQHPASSIQRSTPSSAVCPRRPASSRVVPRRAALAVQLPLPWMGCQSRRRATFGPPALPAAGGGGGLALPVREACT